jgi:hypothetical protein
VFFIVLTLFLTIIHLQRLIFVTDISTRPICYVSKLNNMDTDSCENDAGIPPVYLVSYADGHEVFYRNQFALSASVLGRGVDVIMNYRRPMLDPDFIKKNAAILKEKQGAGFWLWKPWIILNTMRQAPENAIIIYADTGCVFKVSLIPLIDLTKKHGILLCEYEDKKVYGYASKKTKREVFIQLGADNPQYYNKPALWAGFLMLKNTPESRAFIQQWLSYCENPQLLIDGPSTKAELPEFQGHIHDQAILTVLAAKSPAHKYFIPYSEMEKTYIRWHHRRPGAKPQDDKYIYISLLPDYACLTQMRKIEHIFYNNALLKWIRMKMFEA